MAGVLAHRRRSDAGLKTLVMPMGPRESKVPNWLLLVSRTGAVGCTKRPIKEQDTDAHQTPQKVLVDIGRKIVDIEV